MHATSQLAAHTSSFFLRIYLKDFILRTASHRSAKTEAVSIVSNFEKRAEEVEKEEESKFVEVEGLKRICFVCFLSTVLGETLFNSVQSLCAQGFRMEIKQTKYQGRDKRKLTTKNLGTK